jgi:hypothetical protein
LSGRRTTRLILVLLALGAAAWLGLTEGPNGLRDATTAGQRIAAGSQVLYGVTGSLSLIGLLTRARSTRLALAVWVAAVTATATLAPVVWAGSDWWAGALAGVATLAIALLVGWGAAAHLRGGLVRPGATTAAT